jgi:hypothetical protein
VLKVGATQLVQLAAEAYKQQVQGSPRDH